MAKSSRSSAFTKTAALPCEMAERLTPGYREFVYGYAVTSYGSQGKTVDFL